ncbi:orotidine 5'-phosphate decarboxylase / HUMPS family protein, partial [Staphylococcus epidermidis]|uniref:orotidine 5'-phosphate decarboxylase / HUMPS family protein n=1 Tax=Staphylococcus epidermidis TaxID=1282 RepID=UPI0016434512
MKVLTIYLLHSESYLQVIISVNKLSKLKKNSAKIGTPIVINEGLSAVEYMSKSVNNAQVLADLKIMDAAGYEVSQAVKFGADIVTILGVSEDASIKSAIEEAHNNGKELLVDMIAVQNLKQRPA